MISTLWDVFSEEVPLYMWAYNAPMEIVNFPEHQNNQVGARGLCPHRGDQSYFHPVATFLDNAKYPPLQQPE
jgi:hypothetical protein